MRAMSRRSPPTSGFACRRANGAVYKARERGRELHMTSKWNLKETKREDKTGIDLHAFYSYDVADPAQFDGAGV